jgi:prepilin-type N-terminal cleavage/methylation domain-containing protein
VNLKKRATGLTLIELMVAIAIVTLLFSLVSPTYQAFVARAYKAEATNMLTRCAFRLEQYANLQFSYEGSEEIFDQGNLCKRSTDQFDIALSVPSRDRFILTALPSSIETTPADDLILEEGLRYYFYDNTRGFGFNTLSEATDPRPVNGSRLVVKRG